MTRKDIASMFEAMRDMFIMPEKMREYTAREWAGLVTTWLGVFAGDPYKHVWAAVRLYARNGGRFWPFPGEIADNMPYGAPEDEALRTLSFLTQSQAREKYGKFYEPAQRRRY